MTSLVLPLTRRCAANIAPTPTFACRRIRWRERCGYVSDLPLLLSVLLRIRVALKMDCVVEVVSFDECRANSGLRGPHWLVIQSVAHELTAPYSS